ncbi:MAG: polysaccharide pyruvyl transferase family protein [Bacilli bacterium]|nr:polysaccharide pyruvyl transferase family protein [Bacilli bacterium]MDD4808763.1 polysaccharide pyruvyl transferase family protein [Bacilli bacterium]
MKIFIKHLSTTLNYGTMMMGENLITYLNKSLNNIEPEYYIDTTKENDIKRLKEATGYNKIFKDEIFNYNLITKNIKYVRYVEKKMLENSLYKRSGKFYDAVIFLGGDHYSEIYYQVPQDNLIIKNVLKELKKFNLHNKLFMIGQTIGPYTGVRKEWAKETFSNIFIYSRDDESVKYIESELDKKVFKSRDLAFLDLTLQKEYNGNYKNILKKYQLKENEYITIVGTGLVSLYTKNEEQFIKSFVKIINKLKKQYPKKKLVWLSHVVNKYETSNDNTTLKMINEKTNNFIDQNMVVISEELLPVEARIILGHGYFTLTCRMHAAVSTFQMGKPAICLSYSPKYKGVISNGLQMGELVIEAKDDKLWEDKIVDKVNSKVKYIEKNYKKLTDEINNNVNDCQEKVLTMIDIIADNIKK